LLFVISTAEHAHALLLQFITPLLRPLVSIIDAFATPVTLPEWSEELADITTSEELWDMLNTKKPLRDVLTPDFFVCVQAVETKHFPTRFLAYLGSTPSEEYTLALQSYTDDLLDSVKRFVRDYLEAMGEDITPEQKIILEDLRNKLCWALRSGTLAAQGWCYQDKWPLITPTVISAVSDGVLGLLGAITEVRRQMFCMLWVTGLG
jgi:hypothetical protein